MFALVHLKASPNLEAMDFTLTGSVQYEDEDNELYSTVFMNSTVFMHEPPLDIDPKTVFTYLCGAGGAFLLLMLLTRSSSESAAPQKAEKKKKKKEGVASDNEWMEGMIRPPSGKKSSGRK